MYEEDREYYPEEETYARTYEVVVRLVVLAETSEEAEEAVHEVIKEGKLGVIDKQDEDRVYAYDIEEAEPTHIHLL